MYKLVSAASDCRHSLETSKILSIFLIGDLSISLDQDSSGGSIISFGML
jgi:hypothetical protein